MLNTDHIDVNKLSDQFWHNLKKYKKENKISSGYIEKITNTPEPTINRILKDEDPNPTFDNVIGIVFGCNCSFDELFGIKKVTDETGILISTELIENYKKQLDEKDKTIELLRELVDNYKLIVSNMQAHRKQHHHHVTD